MRILVCGSAHLAYPGLVARTLENLFAEKRFQVLIHGGIGGVCDSAELWARPHGIHVVRYPPNWVHYGLHADFVRNSFMLSDGRPTFVVAFPGGSATPDLISRALARNLAVLKVPEQACDDDLQASPLVSHASLSRKQFLARHREACLENAHAWKN